MPVLIKDFRIRIIVLPTKSGGHQYKICHLFKSDKQKEITLKISSRS